MYQLLNILAMLIFGTLGLFVRKLPFDASVIACLRTLIGAVVLGIVILFRKEHIRAERREWKYIWLSAVFLGCNWVFLFQGYTYTTISNATTIYYCAPILIVIWAMITHQQKVQKRTLLCLGISMLGLLCITLDAVDF